jgi:hypothetical protein
MTWFASGQHLETQFWKLDVKNGKIAKCNI